MREKTAVVVPLHQETDEEERQRYPGGWRAGKPEEDPAKVKRWGIVTARPSEYLICMRGGQVVREGQGASIFKWPWESVAVVPTTVQRLHFTADQVTSEKVGVQVTGLAVYRIAQPLIAFRMLNFSFPERAQEKLEQLLVEMFVGAARRLVSNLTVEECLAKRKEGIATELMTEIAPVVSGAGRPEDSTQRGWGVVLDNIEIQDVRILSKTVFANLQAEYRQHQERRAREAELEKTLALEQEEAEAQLKIALAKQAVQVKVGEAKLAYEQATARGQMEMEATRHAAKMAAAGQALEQLKARVTAAAAQRALTQAELEVTELEARKLKVAQELELGKARELREIENQVSTEAIQLMVARQLPQLASAFQQKMGEVHITAVDGANPFGYVAAAVEGVMGLARSAGLELPRKKPV